MKIVPVKELIKEINKTAKKNPSSKKLEKYSKLLKTQKELLDKITEESINKKLNGNVSYEEYNNLKNILKEKKDYEKYKEEINSIISGNYKTKRKIKKRKLDLHCDKAELALVTSFAFFSILLAHQNISKALGTNNKDYNTTEYSTISNTEKKADNSIEKEITEATTIPVIYPDEPVKELYSEYITENKTTEATTAKTTEKQTEKVTEVETEPETKTESTTEYFDDDFVFTDKADDAYKLISDYDDKISSYEEIITDKDKRKETVDKAKKEAKEKSIELIDFVFYGKEMNGMTFDELKDDQKEKVYNELQKLNNTISKYDPDYLDNLGERYQRLKGFGSLTLNKAKEKIKKTVGEDYYNAAGEVKDDIKDSVKDTGKVLKNVISDTYKNWRDKNTEEDN